MASSKSQTPSTKHAPITPSPKKKITDVSVIGVLSAALFGLETHPMRYHETVDIDGDVIKFFKIDISLSGIYLKWLSFEVNQIAFFIS